MLSERLAEMQAAGNNMLQLSNGGWPKVPKGTSKRVQ
jgi:hypothetical protein